MRVRTPQADELTAALREQSAHGRHRRATARCWSPAWTPPAVGRAALAAGVELHELTTERPDLERVFLELTAGKAGIR